MSQMARKSRIETLTDRAAIAFCLGGTVLMLAAILSLLPWIHIEGDRPEFVNFLVSIGMLLFFLGLVSALATDGLPRDSFKQGD